MSADLKHAVGSRIERGLRNLRALQRAQRLALPRFGDKPQVARSLLTE
jgi:hypothetical protein